MFKANSYTFFSVQTVTGNVTLSGNSMVLVDTSAGNIVLTLPAASTVSGRMYTVKKTSNSYTLLLGSAALIDGLPGIELSSSSSAYPYVQVMSDGITWRVLASSMEGTVSSSNVYIIVDVSGGPTATSYPVTVANLSNADLTGADNLQYKTNKIVLRYIPAGTFTMGNTTVGFTPEHPVTLTQGFWAGVFEVTQQQWKNVMGSYPTGTQDFQNTAAGNTMPIHNVSWQDIRGSATGSANWYSHTSVDANTFMGNLRTKTGLGFDLPTEAQWEYSTRAGTSSLWSYGDTENGSYMWYSVNNTPVGTKEVGAKLPNPWGLYDVHGNVWEWCLDWYLNPYSASPTDDPVGALSGSNRVIRGGNFIFAASFARSARRDVSTPDNRYDGLGLRLFLPRSL